MLSTDEQKRTCAQYSKRDKDGFVHCNECPLVISVYCCMCHANSHYNANTCEFELDDCDDRMSAYPDGPMKERIR
jgi:hypothetical protein